MKRYKLTEYKIKAEKLKLKLHQSDKQFKNKEMLKRFNNSLLISNGQSTYYAAFKIRYRTYC